MNHSCNRCFRAGAYVGSGSRDGSGGGEPSEQRRNNIRDTLPNQFHVGIVLVIAHAVGDDSRHQ